MTRESLGSKTTGSDGTASWSYTGVGAGDVSFVAVWEELESKTVTVDDYVPTTTKITLSLNKTSITYGENVTCTAVVTDQHGQNIPSGEIIFAEGRGAITVLGSANIVNGVATLTTDAIRGGSREIRAFFGSTLGIEANAVPITVNKATPTISLLSDKAFVESEESFTLSGVLSARYGGSVKIYDGSTLVEEVTTGTGGAFSTTLSSATGGNHSYTAVYEGSVNYNSVTSENVDVLVKNTPILIGYTGSSFSSSGRQTFEYTGNVFIDWGDNSAMEQYVYGQAFTHSYSTSGNYSIKVYGDISGIKNSGFYGSNLKTISFPDNISSLGLNGFEYCTNLVRADIPSSVTSIANYCFWNSTALTEIILNWDSASDIITYNNTWIDGCTSFDHFLIPEGTTALYTAKNYPSNLLQEAGDTPVPDSIDLTGTKSILSYADSEQSVLTATVLDENEDPIEGVDVNLYNGSTLWDTLTTGSDGTVSKTYTSQGSGDIVFTAEVDGTLLTKTYTVHDYFKYIASGSKTFSTTSHTQFDIADLNDLTGDYEISVTLKSNATKAFGIALNNATATSNQNLLRIGINSSNYADIIRMSNGSIAEANTSQQTYSANTDVVLKLTRVNGVYTAYIDSYSRSYSNAPSNPRYLQVESWSTSKTLTYTDFIVKPL